MVIKMEEKNYEAIIEAILFTMGESVELSRIAAALELPEKDTREILEHMMKKYASEDHGIQILELEDSFQMCTKAETVRISDPDRETAEEECSYGCNTGDFVYYRV